MALIACPECHNQVSSLALTCPHCGVAIAGAGPGLPAAPVPMAPAAAAGPEQTLWQGSPSWLMLLGRTVRTGLFVLAVVVVAGMAWMYLPVLAAQLPAGARKLVETYRGYVTFAAAAVLGLVLLSRGLGLVWAAIQIKSQHYELTNQRLIIESGLLSKALEEIDMRYVEDTQFSQGVVERVLGIGKVLVVSSDKLAPKYQLLGVRDPRQVRELIRSTAYAASQRQFFTRAT